jgi:hypothetical protein
MKKIFYPCLAGWLILSSPATAVAQTKSETSAAHWERSVVHLDVTRKRYDYTQPWSKRLKNTQKMGVVLAGNEILTTADEMFDRTLVRIQKGGRGKWSIGEVSWIDYHANLAIVTTTEAGFWTDLQPVNLADPSAAPELLQIVRWREGKLETRKAEFTQFTVETGHLSFVPRVQLEISSEIQGIGWGEPILSDSKIIGIASEQTGTKCVVLPSSFIRPILEARKKGTFRGLGFFDFFWQPAENPVNLAFLKLEGEPRGVTVIDVPDKPGTPSALKNRDILLQVDGFDIDTQGDYVDPAYGHLSLENLATRGKWAGDDVKLKVWRDGKLLEVTYRLPKANYSATLVPDNVFDQEPEYLIVGGLVFQPLTDTFLQSWGPDWKRRSPFRLYYYNNQNPTPERPALVFLSAVLPDSYNLGYQELRYLVLDEVNGQKISRLSQLREALQKPVNGFHILQFAQSDTARRIVLSAEDQAQATQRVLQRYGIAQDSFIAAPPSAANPTAAVDR